MNLKNSPDTHVVMIGAGIMSATLAILLKELYPNIKITIYEKLDEISGESSDALNNAGTGHSGFCELNYTPEDEQGNINIDKAVKTASEFEVSREFWSYLVETGIIKNPEKFIKTTPHMSFVEGQDDVEFLKKRWEAMIQNPLFKGMEFSEDKEKIAQWIPLMMNGRDPQQKVAVTYMPIGCDVNYGTLTRSLILNLVLRDEATLKLAHKVKTIKKKEGKWQIKVKNLTTGEKKKVFADFVFIGAGGGALRLLEKSGIPEADGYGGFPVSGQWLICTDPEIVKQHAVKVYGKAKIGAPPMSVPHLDSRMIDGVEKLLFGPFAGFSTKFLKNGSYWDLPKSIEWKNIKPMLSAGLKNIPLSKYLIEQVTQSPEEKIATLREFFPEAKAADWVEHIAGQRVQIIKKDEKEGGILQFGTETVHSKDGSIATLLGASPGASTSVYIMLDLMEKCFAEDLPSWRHMLDTMVPSYKKHDLPADYFEKSRERTAKLLNLEYYETHNPIIA